MQNGILKEAGQDRDEHRDRREKITNCKVVGWQQSNASLSHLTWSVSVQYNLHWFLLLLLPHFHRWKRWKTCILCSTQVSYSTNICVSTTKNYIWSQLGHQLFQYKFLWFSSTAPNQQQDITSNYTMTTSFSHPFQFVIIRECYKLKKFSENKSGELESRVRKKHLGAGQNKNSGKETSSNTWK